jgi:hypothetical protein
MQSRQALVQHPADGSIWLFNKRDSFHSLEAVHLSETALARSPQGRQALVCLQAPGPRVAALGGAPSPLEVIIYNLKTDSWSRPLALGEPFKASREIAPVFSTPPWTSPISWRMKEFTIS